MTSSLTFTAAFDPTSGFLPPGRYGCALEDAEALLVGSSAFAGSATRAQLWDGLEKFLTEFAALEDKYHDRISGPLLDRAWLGGSFVSSKLSPRNVDLTLFVHSDVVEQLRGLPGAGIFKKSRDTWKQKYGVSPLISYYRPVANIFRMDHIGDADREYFTDRGRWDDWWQRRRLSEDERVPSAESAVARRGYLEVAL